MNNYKAILGLE